jgi:hypothetical protein
MELDAGIDQPRLARHTLTRIGAPRAGAPGG